MDEQSVAQAHTAGPWRWTHDRCWLVNDSRGQILAIDLPEFIEDADKELIAAAPDLLAAVKAWQLFLDVLPGSTELSWDAAHALLVARNASTAAIAKAEAIS